MFIAYLFATYSLFFNFVHVFVKKSKNKNKKTSRNMFSIENQMQVIPLARNPKEEKTKSPFCNFYPITAIQFMFGKSFPEIMLNVVICSDIF